MKNKTKDIKHEDGSVDLINNSEIRVRYVAEHNYFIAFVYDDAGFCFSATHKNPSIAIGNAVLEASGRGNAKTS